MTDQTFTVAGTSKHNGGFKVRFANDMMRIKNLTKSGHTDIVLVELPKAMTKLDAIKHIATLDEFNNVGSKSAIMDYLDRKDVEPKAKAPAVKADPAAKAPKAKSKVAVAADEDAPF
jgi:DNA gyrase/topoisomerase IV subunit A